MIITNAVASTPELSAKWHRQRGVCRAPGVAVPVEQQRGVLLAALEVVADGPGVHLRHVDDSEQLARLGGIGY